MAQFKDPIREQEIRRWKEREAKDLEVEKNRGPRPLEGLTGIDGAGTTWTEDTDEAASAEVHARDKELSEEASEDQAEPVRQAGKSEKEPVRNAGGNDGPPRH